MKIRQYSPDICDAGTMAYLVSMSESTFREHVRAGTLPGPVKIGGKTLWNKYSVYECIEKLAPFSTQPQDNEPDILKAARGET